MTNVIEQINLLNLCNKYSIHCTLIGTGCIFNNSKNEYSHDDTGNDFTNYYSESRILLEKLVKEFDNYLFLRINYPYSTKSSNVNNPKNLINKLINYEKIEMCNLSATNLDTLLPELIKYLDNNITGIVNFVNEEQINTVTLITDYYKENNMPFNKKIVKSERFTPKLIGCSKL